MRTIKEKIIMFDSINRISIKVTDFCNLDCVYCHQQSKIKDSTSTFQHYDKLESFIRTLPLADEVDVLVTGGEISIKIDEFRRIDKILRKVAQDTDVRFIMSVVTNGTNLPALVKLVKQGKMRPESITVSWDGIYSYTNSRKGKQPTLSDEYFNENIRYIADQGYGESINIAFAITPDTINDMVESLDYCLSVGLQNFSFYYIHEADYSNPEFIRDYTEALEQLAQRFVETYQDHTKRFRYYNWQNMYMRYKLSEASFIANTSCIKLGNSVHIDIDGAVYPCTFFSDHKSMQIGHILEGFYEERVNRFQKEYQEEPDCNYKSCKNAHCFECPASNYILNQGMNNKTKNLCHLLSIEREIFMKYMDTINITSFDMTTFWTIGSTVVEHHYTDKLTSVSNLPYTASREYMMTDENLISNNIERVQSW